MKSDKHSTTAFYGFLFTFVMGWWYLAFHVPANQPTAGKDFEGRPCKELCKDTPPFFDTLSPIDREALQNALAGNFSQISRFITDWDVDAAILEGAGIQGIQRLNRTDFVRSQMIGRLILSASKETLKKLNQENRTRVIQDDTQTWIPLTDAWHKFLPQTYVAASILLALAEPQQIAALPKGLRTHSQIYPQALTKQVPLDIDRYNSEKIFLASPQVAFISYYSHPATVQALKNQGVQLFTLNSINSVEEIQNAVERIGHVINKPLQGELMKLFMEAAMMAIDNRLKAYLDYWQKKNFSPRMLYLAYYTQLSAPASRSVVGQLLSRLGPFINGSLLSSKESSNDWMIPVDKEKIIHSRPDGILISTPNGERLKGQFERDPAIGAIAAGKEVKLFFLDEAVQQSSSQYVVLAYYDIANAVMSMGGQDASKK